MRGPAPQQHRTKKSRLSCAVVAGAECGPSLDGPTSCFAGALERFPRRGAAQHEADVGGAFSTNVTTQVDPLVGGRRDLDKLNGEQISSAMRKASAMAATGIRSRQSPRLTSTGFSRPVGQPFIDTR